MNIVKEVLAHYKLSKKLKEKVDKRNAAIDNWIEENFKYDPSTHVLEVKKHDKNK